MCLTTRQDEIRQFLDGRAPEIAKVFEAGAVLRADEKFPARPYFIAHAVREIINRLPDYYKAEMSGHVRSAQTARIPKIKELAEPWFTATAMVFSATADAKPSPQPPPVSIPMALAVKLNILMVHEAGVKEARVRRFAEFLGHVREMDPADMLESARAFIDINAHGRAHMPEPESIWEEKKALDVWDQLEERLYAQIGARHKIYTAIASITDELNAL